MKALVIKNLNLGFHERVELDELPPHDLVLICGNIGDPKRSLLFAEQVSKLTDNPVLYSLGSSEYCSLSTINDVRTAVQLRLRTIKTNLTWVDDFTHPEIQFQHALGISQLTEAEWKNSARQRMMVKSWDPLHLFYELASAKYPTGYSLAEYNQLVDKLKWEEGKKRVALTAFGGQVDCDVQLDAGGEGWTTVEL